MFALHDFLFKVRDPTIWRVALAAIVAPPLAMAIYGVVLSMALEPIAHPITLDQVLGMMAYTCLYGSILSYLGLALVGLPTFCILKWVDAQRGIAYLLIGALSLPVLITLRSGELPTHLAQFVVLTASGCLVAGAWWLLASR